MASRYSIILSFILATLLVTGTVELFYSSLGKILTTGEKTVQAGVKTAPMPTTNKVTQNQITRSLPPMSSEDYTIIITRNIFGKASSPTDTLASKPAVVLTTTALDLVLLGTIEGKPDAQRAIIRSKKSRKQNIYAKGDTIEHALIKEIHRGKIILTVNGKDEILLMEEIKSPPSTGGRAGTRPMPNVYTPPNGREDDETTDVLAPPPLSTTPKRRIMLRPKKQQVTEP